MTDANDLLVTNPSSALVVARNLATLADEWEIAFRTRVHAAEAALSAWTGEHRESFEMRLAEEQEASSQACQELRVEAEAWAQAWARALDTGPGGEFVGEAP